MPAAGNMVPDKASGVAPISEVKSVTFRIGVHTILDSFSCPLSRFIDSHSPDQKFTLMREIVYCWTVSSNHS